MTYISDLERPPASRDSDIPLNSKRRVAYYDIVPRDVTIDKHMRGIVKVWHPVFWYQLLLIFALSDRAPAKLVGFRASDLAVNLVCDPF